MDSSTASPSPHLRRAVLSPSPSHVPLPPSGPSSRRGSSTSAGGGGGGGIGGSSSNGARGPPSSIPPLMSVSPRTLLRPRLDRGTTNLTAAAGTLLSGSLLREDPFWEGATITVNQPVGSLSISPNSRDVCLASRKGLYILDLKNLESAPRFVPQGGTWQIADCQWSPHAVTDNLILSTSSQKLLVWDLAAQVPLFQSVDAHERAITDINWHAIDPNLMATVAMDAGIRGWDLRMGCSRPFMRLSAWGAAGTQVKWNRRAEHILATAHGKEVIVWDRRKGSIPLSVLKAHDAKIYGIDWDRRVAQELVTCSLDKTIKTWHLPELGRLDGEDPADKPYVARTIVTEYPVWRARNLPFGNGVLSLPQRGETALEMYGANGDIPVERFEGAQNQVKEFVWRVRGGDDMACEDRDFQLVTWSKDRKLRVWPVPREVCERVGYKRGTPITVLVSRKGADPKRTFTAIPGECTGTSRLPLPIVDNHTPMAPSGIARQRLLAHPRESGMTRGGGTARKMDQIEWLTKVVKTGPNANVGNSDSSAGPSRAPSTSGDSMSRSRSRSKTLGDGIRPLSINRATSMSRVGSANDSSYANSDFIPLKDEVLLVHKLFPKSKVNFEKVDLSLRKLTMSLNGPWANGDRFAFIRIHWSFPPNYPYAPEIPTFELERNATVSPITRHRMVSTIKELRASSRQCLVAVTEFLLGYHERTGRRVLDDEGSQSDSDAPALTQNVPMLVRTTGAVFGPNGQLACFFPKQTLLPRARTSASRSPSGQRDPFNTPLNRAIAALGRLENPNRPMASRSRRHVRRLKGMLAPEQARSTLTLHNVSHIVKEPDMTLAAQYSTTSIDANLVYALDAKRLDHAEVWASLRALLHDPPPPYSSHPALRREDDPRRDRVMWEREMERKRTVIDMLFDRLMDDADIQLLALVACILMEHDRTAPPPPVHESLVHHSPEQDYFVLPTSGDNGDQHRASTLTIGSSHTAGRRHSSLTPTTPPVPSSGPSSLRTSGWSQILMNPSSISLRGMTLTPRDRTSFDVLSMPRTPADVIDETQPTHTRSGMIIPRGEVVASPLASSAPKNAGFGASPRRILERRDSQQRQSRDPRPRPLNSPGNTAITAPHTGRSSVNDRDRSGSSDAAAGGSGWSSVPGSRATKVSFGSGSPLRRAFSRHAIALGPQLERRRRHQTCSVRLDFGALDMEEVSAPTSLVRPERLPFAEVWKLAYADMLLRAGLVGRRTAILQYHFATVEGGMPGAASGEMGRPQLELATVCRYCNDSFVPPGQDTCSTCERPRAPPMCSCCREPIRGLATTCTVCSHTSHTRCIISILNTREDHCPACECHCLAERGVSGGFATTFRPPDSTAVSYGFTPDALGVGLGGVGNASPYGGMASPYGGEVTGQFAGLGGPGGLSLNLGPMGMMGVDLASPGLRRLTPSPTGMNFDGPHASGNMLSSPPHPPGWPSKGGLAGGGGALELTDESDPPAAAGVPPSPPLMAPQPQGMLARTRLRALGTEGILGWETATGGRYDHIFLRGGPPTAVTAWVPVGDCHPAQGGLMYLQDSVNLGSDIDNEFNAFNRMGVEKGFSKEEAVSGHNSNMGLQRALSLYSGIFARHEGKGRRWLISSIETGDVVFHQWLMAHASLGNTDPGGRIRLSADLRYADRGHEYDERWDQGPYSPDDGL